MKPSPSILVVVALYAFIAGNATPKVASEFVPMCARYIAGWHALPLPTVHLQFPGAALVFELGIRPAGPRTVPAAPPVIVRLIISRSGNAEISILSHNFRLAFPCRSA